MPGLRARKKTPEIAFKSENIICVDSIPKKIMAPGLLRKACFHASHSGSNGSALFLAAPARPKALTTALFDPLAPLHAVRPGSTLAPCHHRPFALHLIAPKPGKPCDRGVFWVLNWLLFLTHPGPAPQAAHLPPAPARPARRDLALLRPAAAASVAGSASCPGELIAKSAQASRIQPGQGVFDSFFRSK